MSINKLLLCSHFHFGTFLFSFSWDKAYATENENFDKDGLEGEVWFGEESTDRIMRWLDKNKDTIPTSYSILDLGKTCSNFRKNKTLS